MTLNQSKTAIYTGTSLVLMAIIAGIGYGWAFTSIYTEGNPAETYQHVLQQSFLLTVFIACFSLIAALDGIVAWGLFRLTKTFHSKLAHAFALTRIFYLIVLLIAISRIGLQDVSATNASGFYNSCRQFMSVWSVGLVFFGIHLLLWGYLFIRYQQGAKLTAALLMLAGVAYLMVHGLRAVPTTQDLSRQLETVLALPMAVGEFYAAIWLIYSGVRSVRFSRKSVS